MIVGDDEEPVERNTRRFNLVTMMAVMAGRFRL
jgi:hypothetical protein